MEKRDAGQWKGKNRISDYYKAADEAAKRSPTYQAQDKEKEEHAEIEGCNREILELKDRWEKTYETLEATKKLLFQTRASFVVLGVICIGSVIANIKQGFDGWKREDDASRFLEASEKNEKDLKTEINLQQQLIEVFRQENTRKGREIIALESRLRNTEGNPEKDATLKELPEHPASKYVRSRE